MPNRKYYVICESGCRFESMTKEQILSAITQAVETGEIQNVDTGFVTTIKTIDGTPLKFFVGTQARYDALSNADKENLFAIITNDTSKDGILSSLESLRADVDGLAENLQNGNFVVSRATTATNVDKDSEGNTIHTTYRKKADAVHSLSSENGLSSAYDIKSTTLQLPLREGKTVNDIIGIKAQLKVTLAETGTGELVGTFSSFWDTTTNSSTEIMTVVNSGSNAYVVWANLSINSLGKLGCSYAYYILGNEKKTVNAVKIQSIYLYYK